MDATTCTNFPFRWKHHIFVLNSFHKENFAVIERYLHLHNEGEQLVNYLKFFRALIRTLGKGKSTVEICCGHSSLHPVKCTLSRSSTKDFVENCCLSKVMGCFLFPSDERVCGENFATKVDWNGRTSCRDFVTHSINNNCVWFDFTKTLIFIIFTRC